MNFSEIKVKTRIEALDRKHKIGWVSIFWATLLHIIKGRVSNIYEAFSEKLNLALQTGPSSETLASWLCHFFIIDVKIEDLLSRILLSFQLGVIFLRNTYPLILEVTLKVVMNLSQSSFYSSIETLISITNVRLLKFFNNSLILFIVWLRFFTKLSFISVINLKKVTLMLRILRFLLGRTSLEFNALLNLLKELLVLLLISLVILIIILKHTFLIFL